jgi:glyoxylase-like metal-dependent hydrolase (beta-lactamase superfamily II)
MAQPLTPQIRRLTAPNPGPMTHTGTQTYLLGRPGGPVAVIDPGPDDAAHVAAILAAAGEVTHILVTHGHHDHAGAAARLSRETGARVHAFGPARAGRSDYMAALAERGDLAGGEGIDEDFDPDVLLEDGAWIEGEGWRLQALHTPGHLSNHMCFALPEAGIVFTGDTLMGWSSTLISPPDGSVGAFMTSLGRLMNRDERHYLPGHGEAVAEGHALAAQQRDHRLAREAQIRTQLAEGPRTVAELTAAIYADIDPRLHPAAARNVLAHLIDLAERGLLDLPEGDLGRARFSA